MNVSSCGDFDWGKYGLLGNGPFAGWTYFFLLVFLIFATIFVVRVTFGRSRRFMGGLRALEILKERYVSGDIGVEEYERKKKDII
ncbi:MAG: SHOCT domain-containing protein [Candidatus Paceibacterota bacterium]|jgi:uncharacterized membrane protein